MTQLAAEPLECAFLGVDLRRLQPALAQVSDLKRERLDLPDEPSELTFATGRVHHVGRVRQASKATIRAIAATTLPKISKVVGSATCATTTPARTAGSEREV